MKAPIFRGRLLLLGLFSMMGPGLASRCLADVLYDDLGPGNTWIVNREYDTNFNLMAAPFVTTGSGALADFVTPLFSINNPVDLSLYTSSGNAPGTLLENWSVTAPGIPGELTTITSVANPVLTANTEYWLVFNLTPSQKLNLAWYENNQGVTGGIWAGNGLGSLLNFTPDSPAPALEVNSLAVTSTPEPSSALPLAILLGAFVIFRVTRERRRARN